MSAKPSDGLTLPDKLIRCFEMDQIALLVAGASLRRLGALDPDRRAKPSACCRKAASASCAEFHCADWPGLLIKKSAGNLQERTKGSPVISLRTLPITLRMLFSSFLIIIGIGYLTALSYLFLVDVE